MKTCCSAVAVIMMPGGKVTKRASKAVLLVRFSAVTVSFSSTPRRSQAPATASRQGVMETRDARFLDMALH